MSDVTKLAEAEAQKAEAEEPEQPDTGDVEEPESPQEPTQAPEEETPFETPPGPGEGQPEALSEKEMEKALKALDREAIRHGERVKDIMGEDFGTLLACPMCAANIPGFRFQIMPEHAQLALIKEQIGEPVEPDLADDPHSAQCRECRGEGKVKTNSKVQGWRTNVCNACKGKGWIPTDGVWANAEEAASAPLAAVPNGGEQPLDHTVRPEERILKEMGAIVVWPPTPPATLTGV